MTDVENITLTVLDNDLAEGRRVENEEVVSERSPSIDSITHPYRSTLSDTSFPRCHLPLTPAGRTETYTRSMLVLGHGLPIWDPLGNINRPEKHIKSGVSIGDVGILDKDGDFDCFFNVFLPPTDEMQRMCPPDMEPLIPVPGPVEIATDVNYFPPGTTLVSQSVESTQLDTSPNHLNFKIRAREGAILILPDGGSREDLISTTRLREYIQRHALSWYIFLNKRPSTEINLPNGSLYVVTGCDKAHSWAIAAAPHSYLSIGRPFSIEYRGDASPVWQASSGIRCKSTKVVDDSQMYSVFLRGIKVAVSIADWTNHVLQNEPPARLPFYNVLVLPTTGLRAMFQSFLERQRNFPEKYLSPVTQFLFHPSDIILRFMLEESPSSAVALVEDTSLTRYYKTIGDGCAQEVTKFIVRVLDTHNIQSQEGLAMLVPKPSVLKEGESSGNTRGSRLYLPTFLPKWYQTLRRRKEIIARLDKIFPGSPVPLDDLTQG